MENKITNKLFGMFLREYYPEGYELDEQQLTDLMYAFHTALAYVMFITRKEKATEMLSAIFHEIDEFVLENNVSDITKTN